jgi:hypothetical protein
VIPFQPLLCETYLVHLSRQPLGDGTSHSQLAPRLIKLRPRMGWDLLLFRTDNSI